MEAMQHILVAALCLGLRVRGQTVSSSATPPHIDFSSTPIFGSPSDKFFLAPHGPGVQSDGGLILDNTGQIVWDGSEYGPTLAISKQIYRGNDVISLWTGDFEKNGWGRGSFILLDEQYEVVANISTLLPNQQLDYHEFQITPEDTALVVVYRPLQQDLARFNVSGIQNLGWIVDGVVQEINVESGQSVFTWSSLDHIDPNDCYAIPDGTGRTESDPWDYFHVNSVDKDPKGNYLISSRHCHALYYVSGANGKVLWTLGGKKSSFTMAPGTDFRWQHHARWRNEGSQISLFDNRGASWFEPDVPVQPARGLLLDMDMAKMEVHLALEIPSPAGKPSGSQGSMQQLKDGHWLIGWGSEPWFSEYDSSGKLVYSAHFDQGVDALQTYQVFVDSWSGQPSAHPDISITKINATDSYSVAASWNGASDVSYYILYGARDTAGGTLTQVSKEDRSGYQTYLTARQTALSGAQWVQVVAFSAEGRQLGSSDFVGIGENNEGERVKPGQGSADDGIGGGGSRTTPIPIDRGTPATAVGEGAAGKATCVVPFSLIWLPIILLCIRV